MFIHHNLPEVKSNENLRMFMHAHVYKILALFFFNTKLLWEVSLLKNVFIL